MIGPMPNWHLFSIEIFCCSEIFVVPVNEWHQIRGAQMIATMKIISLAFDLGSEKVDNLPGVLEYMGYVLHPGSIVFGPWMSYEEYANFDFHAKKTLVRCRLQIIFYLHDIRS